MRTGFTLPPVLAVVLIGAPGPAPAGERIEYNRHVRPILAENCFACHGPDSASREADLRLDQRGAAVDRGAIVPGKPGESEAIRRIFSDDPDEVMPPPASHKKLAPADKDLLRRWVEAGAEYQAHWSLIAPARPPLPQVKDQGWVRNPIDAFLRAAMEQAGLSPAPEADRAVLARRAWLDLTGLPPAPAELDAFLADPSPDAYERLVDRLLDSKHWGEHRARYWLDAARYADTHGLHFDNYREMWSYRDWVIEAFNRNLPFDQFTVEQLAGDLLPSPSLEQLVATGFNRSNITTNEGGTIPEENLVLYTRDRTETVAQVWLGLTAGCAVCHDHKFDPVPQKEFYQFAAFFNNTTQGAMDGNVKDTPPVIVVPQLPDRARWAALETELADARKQLDARRKTAREEFDRLIQKDEAIALAPPATDQLHLHAPLSEGPGNKLRAVVDGAPQEIATSADPAWDAGHAGAHALRVGGDAVAQLAGAGDFDKEQPFTLAAWVKLDKQHQTGAVFARMDDGNHFRGWDLWVEGGRFGAHLIHRWQEDALKVVAAEPVPPDAWTHVAVTYDGSAKASGVKVFVNGQARPTAAQADALKNTIRTEVPLSVGQRHKQSRLAGAAIHDARIYRRALGPEDVRQLAAGTRAAWLAAKPAGERSEAEKSELFEYWLTTSDKPFGELTGRLAGLEKEQAAVKARGTVAHVTQERPGPAKAHVLFRGEYDKRRDEVTAATFSCLPPMPEDLPRNRLGLARWLLRPEHPLAARVTVNRFWQEVFGAGIVRTAGDFGVAGEMPSHPELLDWLAVEFRESGWDVKKLFRLMVTSAAYRQAAVLTPEKREKDPENRLVSRGPRFRMDAEMVRDYALAASGLLAPTIGGPSVRPYQPDGVWEAVAMIGSDTREYRRDSGESLYRRSLYTFWKRAAPPAAMEIFNAPSREFCTVRRERTNTPLQALAALNDPQLVEAARRLSERTIREGGETDDARIAFMAKSVLARPLRPEEQESVKATVGRLLEHYRAHADDAKQLTAVGESKADPALDPAQVAAWTMLANQLLNLDEALNK